ncbi:short-chain dehydrogenase/reductase SDR family protein [Pseudohyphozyma bogoriensis]|nr:short-chain dehydrogenase/reductase SDR family protein [Pseudohyphozyma bogoriensis]
MSSSADDFIASTIAMVEQTWEWVSSPSQNLHDLPANIHDSLNTLFEKITQGGTLASLPEIPKFSAAPPPPPPPPARSCFRPNKYHLLVAGTGVAGAVCYLYPNTVKKTVLPVVTPLLRPLKGFVPVALLPATDRPLKTKGVHGEEICKEAVLVLGAEGVGAELALDFERRGFVVIATVSSPAEVDVLEKKSRGWMKVLVLDSTDSSSVAPFLRSLTTALSLRFPLHTAGDPFSRPSHTLALTTVLNCLSLRAQTEGLLPIEGMDVNDVRRNVGERVATLTAVLGGVLPILRTMAGRPQAPQGVILNLVPSTTSNLSLPFLSLASAADAAILSMLTSLRRELSFAPSQNLRVAILETGLFDVPNASPAPLRAEPLPVRLNSVYAGALENMVYLGNLSSSVGGERRRKGSVPRKLGKKCFEIVVHGRGGLKTRVGAGAFTYSLLSRIPTTLIDNFLYLQNRLISNSFVYRRLIRNNQQLQGTPTPRATARPLPTPPITPVSASQHPPSLRPGYVLPEGRQNEQHVGDDETNSVGSGASEEQSSIEDFGLDQSGMGSFVGVERPQA